MEQSKRDRITEAALKLFIEHGFHNTSTANISKAAGVATGTLFLYFPNKEALINALYKEAKGQLGEVMKPGFPATADTRSKLKHMWQKASEWALANNDAFRFIHMYKSSPFITTLTNEEVAPTGDFAVNSIKEGMKKGEIATMDIELLFSIIEALLAATVNYINAKQVRNKKQVIEHAFNILWKGIGP